MKVAFAFTIVLVLCTLSSISGQSTEGVVLPVYTHTVYKIDGSMLTGEITAWTGEYVTLRLLSGLEIQLNTKEIQKILSDDIPGKSVKTRRSIERTYQFKEEGMYHVSTGVFSTGPGAGLGVSHAIGHRFSRLLGIGAGVGIESFDVGSGNQIVPIFAEARGFFMPQNISPYYALRGGYGFAIKNPDANISEARGGAAFSAELGYRFGGSKGVNFFTGIGMHFQKAEYNYQWPWDERFNDRVKHRRTEIKFGVIF